MLNKILKIRNLQDPSYHYKSVTLSEFTLTSETKYGNMHIFLSMKSIELQMHIIIC